MSGTSPDSVQYPTVGYGMAVALDDGTGTFNWATLTESGTGQPVRVLANGEDANVSIALVPKGTGGVWFGSNYANYVTITGAANTGVVDTASPVIQAAGAASTLDVKVLGKGTGGRLNSTKVYFGAASDRPGANVGTSVAWKARTTYSGAGFPSWRAGGAYSGTFGPGEGTYNYVAIDADTVDAVSSSGPGLLTGFGVGHAVGAGAVGGRVALSSFLNVGGAITPGPGASSFLVSAAGFAQASASAGGTAGFGNAKGNLFGANFSTRLLSGAGLYWNSLVGAEINVGAPAGTQAAYKIGLQIVQWGDDTVRGAQAIDSGLVFTAQTSAAVVGWDRAITIGHPFGHWPMASTSTLIGTATGYAGSPAYTAAWGVDFSAVTFSGGFLKSNGFEVDGIGCTTGSAFILTSGGPRIVQGSGVPSVLLVLAKGSLYLRNDGAVGSTLYVSQGGGTWNAVAGV